MSHSSSRRHLIAQYLMEPVVEYLIHIGLMSPKDEVKTGEMLQVRRLISNAGRIRRIKVVYSVDPVVHFDAPRKGQCVVYVFNDPDTLYASVTHAKQSVMQLMNKDILVLHVEGVLCEYMHRGLCSYVSVPRSGDEDTDRLRVIDTCMEEIKDIPPIYHCESNDPLASLGVEYVSAVYMPLVCHNVTPHDSIYIALSSEVVSSIKLFDADRH